MLLPNLKNFSNLLHFFFFWEKQLVTLECLQLSPHCSKLLYFFYYFLFLSHSLFTSGHFFFVFSLPLSLSVSLFLSALRLPLSPRLVTVFLFYTWEVDQYTTQNPNIDFASYKLTHSSIYLSLQLAFHLYSHLPVRFRSQIYFKHYTMKPYYLLLHLMPCCNSNSFTTPFLKSLSFLPFYAAFCSSSSSSQLRQSSQAKPWLTRLHRMMVFA